MKIDDIDIYNLPKWLEGFFENAETVCRDTLEKESEAYRNILSETHDLLEKYRFLSTIADGDTITESMNLSMEEVKALSKFYRLEADRKTIEATQIYLIGAKHMWELMELLKLIK
jgi:hypothetical protein